MKKIFSIVAIVLCFAVSSCTKSETIPDDEYVTVSLKMGGELDVTYTPMTKVSDGKGMWGVQILRMRNGEQYPYAFGVFTHYPDDITFVKGDTYEIDVDYIVDADYSVIAGTTSMTNVCLDKPFNTKYWSSYNINEFTYTSSDWIWCLGNDIVEQSIGDRTYGLTHSAFHNNTYDRYYGKAYNYSPAEDNSPIVNMLHCSSSLTVVVKVEDNTEIDDNLVLYFSKLYEKNVTFPFTKEEDNTYKATVPIFACGANSDDPETIPITIGTADEPDKYYMGKFEAVRNTNILCTLTISKSNLDKTSQSLTFSYEDSGMTDVNINL